MAGLAPDASSLAAARRLARPGPWSDTGSTDTLLWGKCQGSGKTPYQVSIDLVGPAFRCSCPSRKFPCKHGLALLLLWVDGSGSVADADEAAGFAQEWAAERSARAEARAAGDAARPTQTPDPAAAAKRLEDRLALMDGGMDDFARWLTDLARGGTAAARHQSYSWWDGTAARLVDAQLPGLADDVRSVGGAVSGRPDWPERLLVALGRWWTATRAWAARESLDDAQMGDLRAYLGWSTSADSVRRADAVTDRWLVLGAHRSDDGRLQQQRTWLLGDATGETVQVLDFAAGGQVLPVARAVGSTLVATVARYPGAAVRRALFADEPAPADDEVRMPSGSTLEHAQLAAARAWGQNPWARRVPVVLADVRVGVDRVVDPQGASLSLTGDAPVWSLLALTGGRPSRVFGELEDSRLRPLTVVVDGEVVGL
ncbi:SWIM zinc finger protein [Humibacillus xanthopallidus]|uniref:SWIM zinc finger protein n=1 Tax=Humibacillus xanthopallidus TaxID=412689 RepID=A0A543I310_9MICO|nr:SWIM zinc finger protein [Humibacillus xanthopallidus]